MKTGAELIADERRRQIEDEGYTAEHDDKVDQPGELAAAACYYAARPEDTRAIQMYPPNWAGQHAKKKSKSRLRQLVVAGALIAAEIDRMQRASTKAKP